MFSKIIVSSSCGRFVRESIVSSVVMAFPSVVITHSLAAVWNAACSPRVHHVTAACSPRVRRVFVARSPRIWFSSHVRRVSPASPTGTAAKTSDSAG